LVSGEKANGEEANPLKITPNPLASFGMDDSDGSCAGTASRNLWQCGWQSEPQKKKPRPEGRGRWRDESAGQTQEGTHRHRAMQAPASF
jgi:hypothetical protein